MADLTSGWVGLELVRVELEPDSVLLDCVVTEIRSITPSTEPDIALGLPVSLRIVAPAGVAGRASLEGLLDGGADLAMLTDDQGSMLLLSLDEQTMALELHLGPG